MASGASGKSPWIMSALNAMSIIAWLKSFLFLLILSSLVFLSPNERCETDWLFLFPFKRGKCKWCMHRSNFSPTFPSSKWFVAKLGVCAISFWLPVEKLLQKFVVFNSAALHCPWLRVSLPFVCRGPSVKAVKVIILQDKFFDLR